MKKWILAAVLLASCSGPTPAPLWGEWECRREGWPEPLSYRIGFRDSVVYRIGWDGDMITSADPLLIERDSFHVYGAGFAYRVDGDTVVFPDTFRAYFGSVDRCTR